MMDRYPLQRLHANALARGAKLSQAVRQVARF